MPPKQRQAVQEYRSMAAAWQGFVDKNKPATYGILSQGYGLIKLGSPRLSRFSTLLPDRPADSWTG